MHVKLKKIFIPYGIAFLFPIFIMFTIFIFQGIYPFGNETLLTIDLGQQYIDFFADYKSAFPHQLDQFIYSFQKGLGGEMTALWAYYLMSPLNLIFLLFPLDYIDLAVSCLILLRYGLASLSMSFFLSRQKKDTAIINILLSSSYALSGYMISYQFNLLWMDGMILLPLIALGVNRLFNKNQLDLYIISLALALISNYYIGYMICLFLILYFIYQWSIFLPQQGKMMYSLKKAGHFFVGSVLAAGMAAFILIPTFLQLPLSKTAHSSFVADWSLIHHPLHTAAKWVIGSFNFDQLPDGMANIFVSGFILVCVFFYFFNSKIASREKWGAGLVLTVLYLSMHIDILNKIWHGFQNPNWFPFRFSFVFIFFLILLAHRQWVNQQPIPLKILILGLALTLLFTLYVYVQPFDFIKKPALLLSFCLVSLYFILVFFPAHRPDIRIFILTALMSLELTANASLTLAELDYLDRDRFITSQQTNLHFAQTLDRYDPADNHFYRAEKTYQRTKNDAQHAGYKGASHFGSTYESNAHRLFSALGYPAGTSFSSYSNSTLLTDSFFNIRYYAADNEINSYGVDPDPIFSSTSMPIVQNKADLVNYEPIVQLPSFTIYENPYVQELAFRVDDEISQMLIPRNYPIVVQNQLAHYLDPENEKPLFFKEEAQIHTHNLKLSKEEGQIIGRPIQEGEKAYIEAKLDLSKDSSYYYVLNGHNRFEDFEFYIDGQALYQYNSFYNDVVINLASQESKKITVRMEVVNDQIYLSDAAFYSLNIEDFKQLSQKMKANSFPITKYNQHALEFDAEIRNEQDILALTLPYDPSWKILANGKEVEPVKLMDSLIGIKLPPAFYHIEMTYQTPYLKTSTVLSMSSALLYVILFIAKKENKAVL